MLFLPKWRMLWQRMAVALWDERNALALRNNPDTTKDTNVSSGIWYGLIYFWYMIWVVVKMWTPFWFTPYVHDRSRIWLGPFLESDAVGSFGAWLSGNCVTLCGLDRGVRQRWTVEFRGNHLSNATCLTCFLPTWRMLWQSMVIPDTTKDA